MIRVGVIFGGRSVEHRVSIRSARTVAEALRSAGHETVALGVAEDGCWVSGGAAEACLSGASDALEPVGRPVRSTVQHLLSAPIEVAFPLVHGTWGEDGTLQGLCEMLDLPYVGGGVLTSALAMDKVLCKSVLCAAGIPVVESVTVSAAELGESRWQEVASGFGWPVFVKPSVGGSSVGVSKVAAEPDLDRAVRDALRFDDRVLVERAIVGRELECSVLGDDRLEASAVGEIVPGNDFYDYSDKYLEDNADLRIPAELDSTLELRLREYAVDAFAAVGGWGMARVDFLLGEDDSIYVNEINTLPGFTSISMYPKLWQASGVSLEDLVDRLVRIAVARHAHRHELDAGIKSWLADLG